MTNNTFQERIDRLAMLYIEKHYDISSLTPAEFISVFNKTCEELISASQNS